MSNREFVDCGDFRDRIYAYQDGELSSGDRSRLEAHLADCETCQGRLAVEDAFLKGLRTRLVPVPAPAGLKARIRADLDREIPRRPKLLGWLMSPVTAGLAAAALLAVVGLSLVPRPGTAADGSLELGGVPFHRVAVLVDLDCDPMGATPEQQRRCLDEAHRNGLKLADGQYLEFAEDDPMARKLAYAKNRRGTRFDVEGRVADAGIIRLKAIRPAQDAL